MRKSIFLILLGCLAFISSCSNGSPSSSKKINAEYRYTGEINSNTYRIKLTLKDDGTAHLQMLDEPIIVHMGDYDLWSLYEDGINGRYEYSKEGDYYKVSCNNEYWYNTSGLQFITVIYIGNDGYLYFDKNSFQGVREGYKYISGENDVKNHTHRGPRYELRSN